MRERSSMLLSLRNCSFQLRFSSRIAWPRFVTDGRQEAYKILPMPVSRSAGLEPVAQEVKLLVLMGSGPIPILAIDDPGFLRAELQTAFGQPLRNGLPQFFGLRLAVAMHDRIIGISLEGHARIPTLHPVVQGVVQKKVPQQGRDNSPIAVSPSFWASAPLPHLERGP
jgi:hypothetical protein